MPGHVAKIACSSTLGIAANWAGSAWAVASRLSGVLGSGIAVRATQSLETNMESG